MSLFRSDYARLPAAVCEAMLSGSVKPRAVKVYLVLTDCLNAETGTAWPSRAEIQRRTGLSLRHVSSAFGDLRELGWAQDVGTRMTTGGRDTQVLEWALPLDPRSRLTPDQKVTGYPRVTGNPEVRSPVTLGSGHRLPQGHTEPIPKNQEPRTTPPTPPRGEGGRFSSEELEAAWRSMSSHDRTQVPEGHDRLRAALESVLGRKRLPAAKASLVLAWIHRRDPLGGTKSLAGLLVAEARKRNAVADARELAERVAVGLRRMTREEAPEEPAPDPDPEVLSRLSVVAGSAQVPRYRRPAKPGRTQARSEPRHAPINTRIDSQADTAANRPRRAPA